jgi:hypothetical protein
LRQVRNLDDLGQRPHLRAVGLDGDRQRPGDLDASEG